MGTVNSYFSRMKHQHITIELLWFLHNNNIHHNWFGANDPVRCSAYFTWTFFYGEILTMLFTNHSLYY